MVSFYLLRDAVFHFSELKMVCKKFRNSGDAGFHLFAVISAQSLGYEMLVIVNP